MIQTVKFRLHTTALQERKLREIFAIYNKVRCIGYKLLFELKYTEYTETEKRGIIQPQLMALCRNNPYVNSILIDNEAKLAQQQTWHEKRVKYVKRQIKEIIKKIKQIVKKIDLTGA